MLNSRITPELSLSTADTSTGPVISICGGAEDKTREISIVMEAMRT